MLSRYFGRSHAPSRRGINGCCCTRPARCILRLCETVQSSKKSNHFHATLKQLLGSQFNSNQCVRSRCCLVSLSVNDNSTRVLSILVEDHSKKLQFWPSILEQPPRFRPPYGNNPIAAPIMLAISDDFPEPMQGFPQVLVSGTPG